MVARRIARHLAWPSPPRPDTWRIFRFYQTGQCNNAQPSVSAPLSGGYVKNRRVSLPNLSPLPTSFPPLPHILSFFFDSGKIAFTRFLLLLNGNFLYRQILTFLILNRDFKEEKMRACTNFITFSRDVIVNYREGGEKTSLNLLNRRIRRLRKVCWNAWFRLSRRHTLRSRGPMGVCHRRNRLFLLSLFRAWRNERTRCRSNTSRPRANTDLRYCGTF